MSDESESAMNLSSSVFFPRRGSPVDGMSGVWGKGTRYSPHITRYFFGTFSSSLAAPANSCCQMSAILRDEGELQR